MKSLQPLLLPLIGLVLAFAVVTVILLGLGERPAVLWEAFHTIFFSGFGWGYTLFYTTPLIFTGLSVAVAFHCGLFNIGAEGQLYVGSLAVILISWLFPNAGVSGVFLGIVGAMVAAGAWGGLAGLFKAKRGTHEVIATILLNFIAISFVNYFILYGFKNPEVQNPETIEVGKGYHLPLLEDMGMPWFDATPVNFSLFIALFAAVAVWVLLNKTRFGFELRSVGKSSTVARFMGINVNSRMVWAFAISGALAGLVGVNEIMGHQHRLIEGYSPGYGATGIAVALLARNNPFGVLASAFLFGSLHNSARELEFLSEKVTKELSLVTQAILIAFVASRWISRRKS